MRFPMKLTAGLTAMTMILASCSVGNYSPGGVSQVSQDIKWGRYQNPPPAKVAGMQGWVQGFRASARAQGISDATLDAAFRDVTYNEDYVIGLEIQKGLETGAHNSLIFGRNERGNQFFHEWLNWYLEDDRTRPEPTM